MNPIVVDIHYLLADKTIRTYAYFVRIKFNSKENGVTMEGPFTIMPPNPLKNNIKWETIFVLLAALSLTKQRIRASEPAPDRPVVVYTNYSKFAKCLVSYPKNKDRLPPSIDRLIDASIKDLGDMDMQLAKDEFPWKLNYNGRKILRKYIAGGLEKNVIQNRRRFTPRACERREQQTTTVDTINKDEKPGG